MKRVLIISPYFAPCNTADSQRIRMSLGFFKDFGWEAEVVCVEQKYCDCQKDTLLIKSLPGNLIVHQVKAFSKKYTVKFGLGSLALRSFWFYFRAFNQIFKSKKYDLVYFSTTEFPLCILGNHFYKKYQVPFVIDMQDAWHTTYYEDKPKAERPAKYWFSYRLNKYLEPLAMKNCGGLISVSAAYLRTLAQRYPRLKKMPQDIIPFGAFEDDFIIAKQNQANCQSAVKPARDQFNIVYIGRGGADMQQSVRLLFMAIKEALQQNPQQFKKLHCYFIGTNYAPADQAKPTIAPFAASFGLENQVTEMPARISFYQTINTLLAADALLVPGSDDPQYNASKIYPYLLAEKPLLAIFHQQSTVIETIKVCSPESSVITFPDDERYLISQIRQKLNDWANFSTTKPVLNRKTFHQFTAKQMTCKQVEVFDAVVNRI